MDSNKIDIKLIHRESESLGDFLRRVADEIETIQSDSRYVFIDLK